MFKRCAITNISTILKTNINPSWNKGIQLRQFTTTNSHFQYAFITKQEIENLLKDSPNENFYLIDVRENSEFTSNDLPPIHTSAHNIPVGDLGPAFLTLDNKQFKQAYGKFDFNFTNY